MSGDENSQCKVPVALGEMKGQEIKSTKQEEIWFERSCRGSRGHTKPGIMGHVKDFFLFV